MSEYRFKVGQEYKRAKVSELVGNGDRIFGNWSTGYPEKNGVTFIFCNIGAGRTGHDHGNVFDGDDLIWRGRAGSRANHNSIERMIQSDSQVHIFWRAHDRDPFTYAGMG